MRGSREDELAAGAVCGAGPATAEGAFSGSDELLQPATTTIKTVARSGIKEVNFSERFMFLF